MGNHPGFFFGQCTAAGYGRARMSGELSGQVAIVAGGASGIGAASVRLLAKGGAKVVIADLEGQREKGEALAKEVGNAAFCPVDVTKTDDIISAVEMAKSMGPLRALVNSAGIGWAQRTIGKDGQYESAANIDAFKRVIAINLVGTFDAIRIAATAMSQTEPLEDGERGAIVNIASVAAFDGQVGQAAYSASAALPLAHLILSYSRLYEPLTTCGWWNRIWW